ncbi:MAG: hypothetical protein OHK0046_11920 [Anaerolineae bacterium]
MKQPVLQRTSRTRALFAAAGALLLAALVRIINIDGPALWTDEGFTTYTFTTDLFNALVGDRHPPFYFYTLHGWVALAGDSILAMRWWSFLPSLLSIAIMFQIGREMVRQRPGIVARSGALGLPVLAALLMALADGENYLAQELRMYTWHVFFAAGSLLFYLRYTRRPTRAHVAGWVVFSTLLIYTHYFGAYVLMAQGLHVLLFLRGRVRLGAIGALIVTGLLFLPWFLGVTVQQFAQDAVCVTCAPPNNWERLLEFRLLWFGQQWPLMLLLFGFGLVRVMGLVGSGSAVPNPYRQRSEAENARIKDARTRDPRGVSGGGQRWDGLAFLLALMIALPIGITYLLGHEEDIFFAHRLSQITVPITLLLALGIAYLRFTARWVLVLALTLYGVTTIDWYRIKVPWDTVTELVAPLVQSGEVVFVEVGPEESALRYYLDHALPPRVDVRSFPMWGITDRHHYYHTQVPTLLAEQRVTQTDEVKSVWIIYFTLDTTVPDYAEAEGYARTMRRVYTHVDDSSIEVFRYDLLPETSIATFDNGLTLRAAEIVPEHLRVDLWWQTETPLTQDFVISAFLLDANGQLVAQKDSVPMLGERSTLGWASGEVVYDPRLLELTGAALPPGEYTVGVQVYSFSPDGQIVPLPLAEGEPRLILGTLTR